MSAHHHGEYKVHGGKLVVADLEVAGGRLEQVSISGDFFLEPDEALLHINTALEGMSAESSHTEFAASIAGALPPDAVLFGFSPDAVAVAVRRALAKASGWLDHSWQVIPPTPLPTHMHVAMDEVLTR
ncbi:lipoate--protein ligase family protein, partial [Arthrobacter deserti]|nr:lipoate--protein ligase family protein [Arthrobacter deserti]